MAIGLVLRGAFCELESGGLSSTQPVPAPDELVPMAGHFATGAKGYIGRPFFETAPDIRQNDGFHIDHVDAMFLDPVVCGCQRGVKRLVFARLDSRGPAINFRTKSLNWIIRLLRLSCRRNRVRSLECTFRRPAASDIEYSFLRRHVGEYPCYLIPRPALSPGIA